MKTNLDALGKRFISDFNLPFEYIDYNHFMYCLNLFDKTKDWYMLMDIINQRYGGNPNKFLDEYYQIRDKIINDILNKPDYNFFVNQLNLNDFALDKESRNINSNNIYNRENIGKMFLSIDLKSANFQTLKHVSSSLVNNKSTYEDFIGDYTDLDYIKKSKYTRQVIFGKTNAKRQITCEKFFINEIRKLIESETHSYDLKLISMSNDELVYELTGILSFNEMALADLVNKIYTETDFIVHGDLFTLNGYEFQFMETGSCKFTFYEKVFNDGTTKLISVPKPYYKMVYKLMNDITLRMTIICLNMKELCVSLWRSSKLNL